ncbi:Planctomycete cytochrome C [Roseivivax lentus]|uniref:Planctomycete cytochrome C n=1 Tax=Roseivivax lentus TaxID=633194 RepID=A0A1N7NAL1_9RHOB|nr:c-type cytochrome domain-containing protein [Roseivivax lentus]SIS95239.1 Planctomycete cytochrome C [Roseivivax lentus]
MRKLGELAVWSVLTLTPQPARADELAAPTWADVFPIFELRCVNCHAEHGASKGLRLDSYAAILAGSDRGAVVLPGLAAKSELIRRLTGESAPRMPFLSTPLPDEEVALIVRWIDGGAREAPSVK